MSYRMAKVAIPELAMLSFEAVKRLQKHVEDYKSLLDTLRRRCTSGFTIYASARIELALLQIRKSLETLENETMESAIDSPQQDGTFISAEDIWKLILDEMWKDSSLDKIIKYVPEGHTLVVLNDVAKCLIPIDVNANVWKQKRKDGTFRLCWSSHYVQLSNLAVKEQRSLKEAIFIRTARYLEEKKKANFLNNPCEEP